MTIYKKSARSESMFITPILKHTRELKTRTVFVFLEIHNEIFSNFENKKTTFKITVSSKISLDYQLNKVP